MNVTVREGLSEEALALASAVIGQPLLRHYEIQAGGLGQALAQALARQVGLLVVEAANEMLGFAWFLESGTFALGGYLRLIALRPGREGSGVGAALLDRVEERVAKKSHALFLLVSHWNEGARRFYARRGYDEVGKLPALLRPDTDEIIYCKRFLKREG